MRHGEETGPRDRAADGPPSGAARGPGAGLDPPGATPTGPLRADAAAAHPDPTATGATHPDPAATGGGPKQGDPPATAALPLIGAQLSTAGSLEASIERARAIGAEAIQVFPSNPRQWRPGPYAPEVVAAYGRALRRARLPLYVHTIYLINLASPDDDLRAKSAASLADALLFGALAGAAGVVTHVGSHRGEGFEAGLARVARTVEAGYRRLEERLPAALAAAEAAAGSAAEAGAGPPAAGGAGTPPLLLETSAGGGDSLGRDPRELGRLLGTLPGDAGVCLDTAHLYAAGFPLDTVDGLRDFLARLGEAGCLDRVRLVHLNDSKTPLGSRSDRHENLWDGCFGRHGLRHVMADSRLHSAPFILEVPGVDGDGPDRGNIRRARTLRREAMSPR